jgi:hypothetical protein
METKLYYYVYKTPSLDGRIHPISSNSVSFKYYSEKYKMFV